MRAVRAPIFRGLNHYLLQISIREIAVAQRTHSTTALASSGEFEKRCNWRDVIPLPQTARQALGAQFDYQEARIQTLPMKFACPSVVLRDGDTNSGATEVFQPWSEAVAEG